MNKEKSRFLISLLVVSLAANLICEYWHIPLFNVHLGFSRAVLALLAAMGDTIFLFAAYFFIAKIYQNDFLLNAWNLKKVFLVIFLSDIIVIVAEKFALASGLWSYQPAMPVMPIIDVGLTPLLHYTIVPIAVLYFCSKVTRVSLKTPYYDK